MLTILRSMGQLRSAIANARPGVPDRIESNRKAIVKKANARRKVRQPDRLQCALRRNRHRHRKRRSKPSRSRGAGWAATAAYALESRRYA